VRVVRGRKAHSEDPGMSTQPNQREGEYPSSIILDMLDRINNFVDQFHRYSWDNPLCIRKCPLKSAESYSRFLRRHSWEKLGSTREDGDELTGKEYIPMQWPAI
jgi:hypothetical protein